MNFYDREMATYNQFTKSPGPNINSAAYVYKRGESVSGNQVRIAILVAELDYRKATQSSRGKNGPAPLPQGGSLL